VVERQTAEASLGDHSGPSWNRCFRIEKTLSKETSRVRFSKGAGRMSRSGMSNCAIGCTSTGRVGRESAGTTGNAYGGARAHDGSAGASRKGGRCGTSGARPFEQRSDNSIFRPAEQFPGAPFIRLERDDSTDLAAIFHREKSGDSRTGRKPRGKTTGTEGTVHAASGNTLFLRTWLRALGQFRQSPGFRGFPRGWGVPVRNRGYSFWWMAAVRIQSKG